MARASLLSSRPLPASPASPGSIPSRRSAPRVRDAVVAFRLPAQQAGSVARRLYVELHARVRAGDELTRHGDHVLLTLQGAAVADAERRVRALCATLPRCCRLPFAIDVTAPRPASRRPAEARSATRTAGGDPEPWWKRPLDVAGASAALLMTAPVLLAAATLVRCTSRGPVLYRQWRAGKDGVPFRCLKFRTMVDGAEHMQAALRQRNEMTGPLFKMKDDPRVTAVGRWLRRLSIDELPQLWNVLRGEMSLVGPRPATLDEVASYEPWQRERLSVRQGLTGSWQVEGRGRIGFPESARMDIRYCRRRSLRGDLRLLWRTIGVVLGQRGAH